MANKPFEWRQSDMEWRKVNPKKSYYYKYYPDGEPLEEKAKPKEIIVKSIIPHPKRANTGQSGIYAIVCEVVKRAYIGQSINMETRLRGHKGAILSGLNKTTYYQKMVKDCNVHGIEAFTFNKHKLCEQSMLNEEEVKCMREFIENGYDLYNISINLGDDSIFCPVKFQPTIKALISLLINNHITIDKLTPFAITKTSLQRV